MEKYLPLALRAARQKLEKLHTRYLYFSGNSRNYQVLCSDILYLERNLRQTTIYTKTGTGLQSSDPQTGYSGFSSQNCTGTSELPVTPGAGKT